jgi:hypothetical protein
MYVSVIYIMDRITLMYFSFIIVDDSSCQFAVIRLNLLSYNIYEYIITVNMAVYYYNCSMFIYSKQHHIQAAYHLRTHLPMARLVPYPHTKMKSEIVLKYLLANSTYPNRVGHLKFIQIYEWW